MRGKPGDIPPRMIARIKRMRAAGYGYGTIAKRVDLAKSTVRYHASHDAVLEERKRLRAKTPLVQEQHCSLCGEVDHNAQSCKRRAAA